MATHKQAFLFNNHTQPHPSCLLPISSFISSAHLVLRVFCPYHSSCLLPISSFMCSAYLIIHILICCSGHQSLQTVRQEWREPNPRQRHPASDERHGGQGKERLAGEHRGHHRRVRWVCTANQRWALSDWRINKSYSYTLSPRYITLYIKKKKILRKSHL